MEIKITIPMVVSGKPVIMTTTLPPCYIGVPYGPVQCVTTGWLTPVTWSAANLPSGIVMSPGGSISGTATGPVTPPNAPLSVTLKVDDGNP